MRIIRVAKWLYASLNYEQRALFTLPYTHFVPLDRIKHEFKKDFNLNDFLWITINIKYGLHNSVVKDEDLKNWEKYIDKIEYGYNLLKIFNIHPEEIHEQHIESLSFFRNFGKDLLPFDEKQSSFKRVMEETKLEFQRKLKKFLIENNLLKTKEVKSVKNKPKSTWNNIKLMGKTDDEVNFLIELLNAVQNHYHIKVKSDIVKLVRISDVHEQAEAQYNPKSKLIIIGRGFYERWGNHLDFYFSGFIHEYAHAIDFVFHSEITKTIENLYKKAMEYLYNETKEERFNPKSWHVKFEKGEVYGGKYDNLLRTAGYPSTYALTNMHELFAETMEHYFDKENLNQDLKDFAMLMSKYFQ